MRLFHAPLSCLLPVACIATVALVACLKAEDEIEIVDSSVGGPIGSPQGSATPGSTFVDSYLSAVSSAMRLSQVETAAFEAAALRGISRRDVTGQAADAVLEDLLQNSTAWVKEAGKASGNLESRTGIAAQLLVAGYTAAKALASQSGTSVRESHLRAVSRALGSSFVEVFNPTASDLIENYSLFALNIASFLFTELRTDGALSEAALVEQSSWIVGEMAGSLEGQKDTDPDIFTEAYCRLTAELLIRRLTTTNVQWRLQLRNSNSSAILASLASVFSSSPPALEDCTSAMDASLAD